MLRAALPSLTALALAASLAACGGDDDRVAEPVAGTSVPADASDICALLPLPAVQAALPGAQVDTGLKTIDSCLYASDAGDLILSVFSEERTLAALGTTPTLQQTYDLSLEDATANGADDVRAAPQLGVDGQLATNAQDYELTAVWKRGDAVYVVQYSSWEGSVGEATKQLEGLAGQVAELPAAQP